MWKWACLLGVLLSGCSHAPFYYPKPAGAWEVLPLRQSSFFIPSQSGNRLHVTLLRAERPHSQGLVVHFHGNSGHVNETIEKYEWVNQIGYDMLSFDYSGYGFSSGEPTAAALQQDANTIYRFVQQQFTELPDYQLIAIGTSMGGAVMLHSLAQAPQREMFDLIVVDSSFPSYAQVASHVLGKRRYGWLYSWLPYLAISSAYDAGPQLSAFTETPMLFVHCTDDQLIPWQYSQQMQRSVSVPSELLLLPGCAHARSFTPESAANRPLLSALLAAPGKATIKGLAHSR